MKYLKSCCLAIIPLLLLSLPASAQNIELSAIVDFENIEAGEVPYYRDLADRRNVLAINAAIEGYRGKFARANHVFDGPTGIYDISLYAMTEIDGEGEYHVLIDGLQVAEVVNPPTVNDFEIIAHRFDAITLTTGSTISVESNAVSNDTIPEGDGFAFARGRWKSLVLEPQNGESEQPQMMVDLALTASPSTASPSVGDGLELTLVVANASTATVATSPQVTIDLPDTWRFDSSADCAVALGTLLCQLAEIQPGATATIELMVSTLASGSSEITASVSADQVDSEQENNAAILLFETTTVSAGTGTVASSDNTGGALSICWLLCMLLYKPLTYRRLSSFS